MKLLPQCENCGRHPANNNNTASFSKAAHQSTITKDDAAGVIILYGRRWLVLASFALLSTSSAWMWITWSPIASLVSEMWDVSEGDVDALSGIYMYIYVVGSFLSLYLVVNHIGLYRGLVVGGIFNFIGASIRYLCVENYRLVYIGTVFCAVAQTFTLSTPPLIAGSWFGASERATATALGVIANQLGTMLGMSSTILLNFEQDMEHDVISHSIIHLSKLQAYLRLQWWVALMAVLLVLSFGADRPSTPPNKAAALTRASISQSCPGGVLHEQSPLLPSPACSIPTETSKPGRAGTSAPGYVESFQMVFSDASHVAFVLSFGMSVGVYYTMPTFLSQLLPSSWPLRWSGWLGLAYQCCGILGSFGSGQLVDRTGQHRRVCHVWLQCAALFLFLLWIALAIRPADDDGAGATSMSPSTALSALRVVLANVGIIAGIALTGMSLAAWNSVGMEYGAALAYPANEAAVAGILECAAEMFGYVWVSMGGHVMVASNDREAQLAVLVVLFLAVVTSLVLFQRYPMESKRPS